MEKYNIFTVKLYAAMLRNNSLVKTASYSSRTTCLRHGTLKTYVSVKGSATFVSQVTLLDMSENFLNGFRISSSLCPN